MAKGPDSPSWRGGRIIKPNGYIHIKVGVEHHLAHKDGYAAEHRLVAEEILGRRLTSGEMVHHKDGNPANNRPENLDVVQSKAEHSYKHRKPDCRLRAPGEKNPTVPCGCGCGATFKKYDKAGRPRLYVHGSHHQRVAAKQRRRRRQRTVVCACGCGAEFPEYDRWGRKRQYAQGHGRGKRNG